MHGAIWALPAQGKATNCCQLAGAADPAVTSLGRACRCYLRLDRGDQQLDIVHRLLGLSARDHEPLSHGQAALGHLVEERLVYVAVLVDKDVPLRERAPEPVPHVGRDEPTEGEARVLGEEVARVLEPLGTRLVLRLSRPPSPPRRATRTTPLSHTIAPRYERCCPLATGARVPPARPWVVRRPRTA